MRVVVFNVGSTTLKYARIDTQAGITECQGTIDRIGQAGGEATDHDRAAELAWQAVYNDSVEAIGHRLVQGGELFQQPTRVDQTALEQLCRLDSLAPLHNPPARRVLESLYRTARSIPHVMIFDTAYFANLPPAAAQYAIPANLAAKHQIKRYGAHGTSHEYVTRLACHSLGWSPETDSTSPPRIISLHLGGGASVTASLGLRAMETSMGFTPLEGLVMATRCGDLDPSIPGVLMERESLSPAEIDSLLNRESGLKGLCGETDMRAILQRIDDGDAQASAALDIYVHRIRKYLGAYLVVLGGVDAIVFTAGVGEHSPAVRRQIVERLTAFGIELDEQKNQLGLAASNVADIAAASSRCRLLIVATAEEQAIAAQTAALLA
ncbi:acetate/propionate family kinase [Planctomycetaceae bacterium SH139]